MNIIATTQVDLERELALRIGEALRVVGDEHWFVIRPNVYAIPQLDGYILYSPLQGLTLLITQAGFASLLLNPTKSYAACLTQTVLDDSAEQIEAFDKTPMHEPQITPVQASEFKPLRLTLSLTAACQLACTYCYIRGGDKPRHMPLRFVEAAIRFVAGNLQEAGKSEFELEFHGQGEPTAQWNQFKKAITLVEHESAQRGLTPKFSLVTNGILTPAKVDFLAAHNVAIGLSFDGLKETMDAQRPMRSGQSSFTRILKTIELFEAKKIDFSIRSTVTWLNLHEMKELIVLLKERSKCTYVNFEPVCATGRAQDEELDTGGIVNAFIDEYRKARHTAHGNGIEVGYSTARTDGLRASFCGAYGTNLNFCISTEGLVSTCYEVLDESDPRAEIFIYGRINPDTLRFEFNQDKLNRLLGLNVNSMDRCKECYVRWNCGGDCLSKIALAGIEGITNDQQQERCIANRALTKDAIFQSLFTSN